MHFPNLHVLRSKVDKTSLLIQQHVHGFACPCLLPLRPIKGWLVASQYINRAQEAGTASLWAKLDGRAEGTNSFDD